MTICVGLPFLFCSIPALCRDIFAPGFTAAVMRPKQTFPHKRVFFSAISAPETWADTQTKTKMKERRRNTKFHMLDWKFVISKNIADF